MNKKFEEILSTTKLNELLKREEKKECSKKILFAVLAVIGIVAVVAGIAYLVYRCFFAVDELEDFDDECYEYDDDFDCFDDEDDDEQVVEINLEEDVVAETPVEATEEIPAE